MVLPAIYGETIGDFLYNESGAYASERERRKTRASQPQPKKSAIELKRVFIQIVHGKHID